MSRRATGSPCPFAGLRSLLARLDRLAAGTYDALAIAAVLDEVQRVVRPFGKRGAPAGILRGVERLATAVQGMEGDTAALRPLFDSLLDLPRGEFRYDTYVAREVLAAHGHTTPETLLEGCVSDLVFLTSDIIMNECEGVIGGSRAPGHTGFDRRVAAGRLREAVILLRRVLNQEGLASAVTLAQTVESGGRNGVKAARELRDLLSRHVARVVPESRRMALQRAILPTSAIHDEYLFLRVVQGGEVCFGAVATGLRSVMDSVEAGALAQASAHLDTLAQVLRLAHAQTSLLFTLSGEAFASFRHFTEGAGAIQAAAYKTIEVLCSRPSDERLDSVAFAFLPELREFARHNPRTLDVLVGKAIEGSMDRAACDQLVSAALAFDRAFIVWKNLHATLAVRIMAALPVEEHVVGPAYLLAGRSARLLPTVAELALRPVRADETEARHGA